MVYSQGYNPMSYQQINPFMNVPIGQVGYNQNVPMQQQNTSQIFGRIVPSVDVIIPSEVPMDGSVSVFPKNDFSEIYLKSWNQNGTINTVIYKPETKVEDDSSNVTLDSLKEYMESFKQETLERFDRLENQKQNGNKTTTKIGEK